MTAGAPPCEVASAPAGAYDDGDYDEGRYSPKKVTFSEKDQIKLMSMESLLSTATSDTSTCEGSAISGPIMSAKAHGSAAPYKFSSPAAAAATPKRNQVAHYAKGKMPMACLPKNNVL